MASKKPKKPRVRKPAKKTMKRVKVPAKKTTAKKTTAKKTTAKKTTAKKTTAKKTTAKKTTAKKTTAKKTTAKKTTAKKKTASKRAVKVVQKAVAAKQKRGTAAGRKVVAAAAKKAAKRKAEAKKAAALELAKAKKAEAAKKAEEAKKSPRLRSQPVEVQEIDVQIQRTRRSRLDAFQPRSYGSKPKKPKAGGVLEALNKHMCKAPPLRASQIPQTVVELGIFCIFAMGGNSARVSLDGTKRLVGAFPEWNEFRVSEAYEFLEAIEGVKVREPYDRCEQVLEFINEVYQDQNAVDLEFLRDMTPADRLVALNRYRSLGPALSHYIALALQDFEGVLFHYSWARPIQRMGLVPRSGSPNTLVQSFTKAFSKLDTVSAQVNLIDLGEEICQSKSPNCRHCYLVMCCKSRKI